jgi:lysine-specific demethylase 8
VDRAAALLEQQLAVLDIQQEQQLQLEGQAQQQGEGGSSSSSGSAARKRAKVELADGAGPAPAAAAAAAEAAPRSSAGAGGQVPLPPGSFSDPARQLPRIPSPSLERFAQRYMAPPATSSPIGSSSSDGLGTPVVLTGTIGHWPALARWADPGYFIRVAGYRTVPVEVGQHYLSEGWGTQLMPMGQFVRQHLLGAGEDGLAQQAECAAAEGSDGAAAAGRQGRRGYLAQHQLLDQLPVLAADVSTPDYCALGEGELLATNAWLGPAGTVTPLHTDPHHNLLAQVCGTKYIRLYSPAHTPALYPYQEGLTTNSSQVGPGGRQLRQGQVAAPGVATRAAACLAAVRRQGGDRRARPLRAAMAAGGAA